MKTIYFKKKLAILCACILTTFAFTSPKSEGAMYDLYWDSYVTYYSWAAWTGNWSTWYWGYAMPYYHYNLAGWYGDYFGYYDSNGWKEVGWGPYYYELYAWYGDWYWRNY